MNRLAGSQGMNKRTGLEPNMLWHQVLRSDERGWRGEERERAREDVLCICTMHVPTREKSSCVERRKGTEEVLGALDSGGKRSPVLKWDLTRGRSQI